MQYFGIRHCSFANVFFVRNNFSQCSLCLSASTVDGLYGNLLAAADEEGSVRLMDTARPASKSLVKGTLLADWR